MTLSVLPADSSLVDAPASRDGPSAFWSISSSFFSMGPESPFFPFLRSGAFSTGSLRFVPATPLGLGSAVLVMASFAFIAAWRDEVLVVMIGDK